MKAVICWGATGQAKVLREALSATDSRIVAVFDNRDLPSPLIGVPLFQGPLGLAAWERDYVGERPVRSCVAVGGVRGKDRLSLLRWLEGCGFPPLTILHPRSFVADDAVVGDGCQILALAAVCAEARLGTGVIVNTSASIDHDCVVGDGAHIGPGATLAGEVVVGDFAFVGTGAVVLPRVRIGEGAVVGAGAVVVRDIPAGTMVVGNPARAYMRQSSAPE